MIFQVGDRVQIVDAVDPNDIRSGHKHAGKFGTIAGIRCDSELRDFPWKYEVDLDDWKQFGTTPFHPEELVLVNDGQ